MLLGVGARRVAKVADMLRRANSAAIGGVMSKHGNASRAPTNKTDADTEAEILRHLKEWIKYVPESTKSGKSYAKFSSWDVNSVASLANHFNDCRSHAKRSISLTAYKRIVQEYLRTQGIDKLYGMDADHNVCKW